MPEPSISIAMCTYNSERYLREQLDSFVAQTRRPDELVICDDASTDSTPEMIADFARTAPFEVRIWNQPANVGRMPNFEKSIALCSKDIIFLSDADDVWHVDKLDLMAQALQSAPHATGVFCDAEIVDAELRPLGRSVWEHIRLTPALQSRVRNGDAVGPLLRSQIVQGAALAFRASCRPLLLPLSSRWGHDSWIAVLLFTSGDLVPVNTKLLSYRQHETNLLGVMGPRPSRLQRLVGRFRDPRAHYRKKLAMTLDHLAQMDDLRKRLDMQTGSPRHSMLLAGIAQQCRTLNRRRRRVEAILSLVGDRVWKPDRRDGQN